MAPLPANNTARMFFDYISGSLGTSRQHTVMVRYNSSLRDVSDVQADFLGLLNIFGAANFRAGWRVEGVRVSASGSDFSTPVTVIASLAAFVGTASPTYSGSAESVEDTFQGRSQSSGRRVDFSLYRALNLFSDNFRVNAGASALPLVVGNAATYLDGRGVAGSFLAIDGQAAVWKRYMNQNFNSYWEARSRTT